MARSSSPAACGHGRRHPHGGALHEIDSVGLQAFNGLPMLSQAAGGVLYVACCALKRTRGTCGLRRTKEFDSAAVAETVSCCLISRVLCCCRSRTYVAYSSINCRLN
jgi:hypothetical protein